MCGFVAYFQDSPIFDVETARQAIQAIFHRGPDAGGEWCEHETMLLHRRLSIIDLHSGDQPMVSGDGRYVIVFNGEIYNFPDLRTQLTDMGSVFRTRSDTEVILEGYKHWGKEILQHLNGIFAFVIWDRKRRAAFGARDRLGIKPLCWFQHRGALIVASTLEPIHGLSEFRRLNLIALRELMSFDYIPSPHSILEGVQKLEPGRCFEWQFGDSEPTISRFWRPPLVNTALNVPDDYELEAILERAVARQMVSDVPLGAFLSGGIDSSLLVAFMARQSEKPVRTFSCSFGGSKFDESPIARLVASRFGTDHNVLPAEEIGPDSLLDLLGRLDEPFADPAVIPTIALSQMTARHVRVALAGDGADEIFGGYPKYLQGVESIRRLPFSSFWQWLIRKFPGRPRRALHIYCRTLSSQNLIRWSWSRYGDFPIFSKDIRLLINPIYHDAAKVEDFFSQWEQKAQYYGDAFDMDTLMRTDLETYLSENCLVKTDRASMLSSLEVRVPYLDESILDRILPLPGYQKIVNGTLKARLMPLAQRILPREVWDRPKQGFHVPLGSWLGGKWRPAVDTVLDWGERNLDVFNYQYLHRLHRINIAQGCYGRELWTPFAFLAWMMRHSLKV